MSSCETTSTQQQEQQQNPTTPSPPPPKQNKTKPNKNIRTDENKKPSCTCQQHQQAKNKETKKNNKPNKQTKPLILCNTAPRMNTSYIYTNVQEVLMCVKDKNNNT